MTDTLNIPNWGGGGGEARRQLTLAQHMGPGRSVCNLNQQPCTDHVYGIDLGVLAFIFMQATLGESRKDTLGPGRVALCIVLWPVSTQTPHGNKGEPHSIPLVSGHR